MHAVVVSVGELFVALFYQWVMMPQPGKAQDDWVLGCDGDQERNLFMVKSTGLDENGLIALP